MSFTQDAKEIGEAERHILEVARSTMLAAENCFLITLDALGHPQARLIEPFDPEPDMKVWMATNPKTRKVHELYRDSRATLAYYDHKGTGYVALIGQARLVNDPNERRRRWKEHWRLFYPEGAEGNDYILIEFTPSHIEIISFGFDVATEPLAFHPAILVYNGSTWLLEV